MAYNRYSKFTKDGKIAKVPFIKIPIKNTDIYATYIVGRTRLDILSYQYYGDPNYEWLILQANPEYGPSEYLIPDNTRLRIPYPLDQTISQYENDIDTYIELYGLEFNND